MERWQNSCQVTLFVPLSLIYFLADLEINGSVALALLQAEPKSLGPSVVPELSIKSSPVWVRGSSAAERGRGERGGGGHVAVGTTDILCELCSEQFQGFPRVTAVWKNTVGLDWDLRVDNTDLCWPVDALPKVNTFPSSSHIIMVDINCGFQKTFPYRSIANPAQRIYIYGALFWATAKRNVSYMWRDVLFPPEPCWGGDVIHLPLFPRCRVRRCR